MIRFPPTAIVLGRSDLQEFDRRQKLREVEAETETVKQQFAGFEVGGHDGPSFADPKKLRRGTREMETVRTHDRAERSTHTRALTLQIITNSSVFNSESGEEPSSSMSSTADAGESTVTDPPVDEHSYVSIRVDVSPENVAFGIDRASSPLKDDFYFGGFTESPTQCTADNTPRSSLFGTVPLFSNSRLR
jgi:hypothetical protein